MHIGLSVQIGSPAADRSQTILHDIICKNATAHESNTCQRCRVAELSDWLDCPWPDGHLFCSTWPSSTTAAAKLYRSCIARIAIREQPEESGLRKCSKHCVAWQACSCCHCLRLGHSCGINVTAASSMERLHVKVAMQAEPIRQHQEHKKT